MQQIANQLINDQLAEIKQALKTVGADTYDLLLPETYALVNLLQVDEYIAAIVYGKYRQMKSENEIITGRGALIITDKRVMLVDKKPLFLRYDEVPFQVVIGVTYSRIGLAGTIVLHSRIGDITIRTFNHTCATIFVAAVEAKLFENNQSRGLL